MFTILFSLALRETWTLYMTFIVLTKSGHLPMLKMANFQISVELQTFDAEMLTHNVSTYNF